MKKLLAVLLAALMLCGFGVGASAQAPEELLAQTMRDLQGNYTILGSKNDPGEYERIIYNGEAYAFIRADGVRDIHFKDKAVRVYPERNAWHTLSSPYSSTYLPLLASKEIPKDASITVKEWYGSLEIAYDGYSYWYKDGALWSIDGSISPDILIDQFIKEADPGAFSLEGLRRVPELSKWMWEPQESAKIFLADHATMNKAVDTMLSWGLTALVIVCMPLLYVVILVLRVLFYFDIYKA